METFGTRRLRLVVGMAIVLWPLSASTAHAGLQAAIDALMDRLEASNPVRDFVPPVAGNDALPLCVGAECSDEPARWGFQATLVYDWNTGNLSAHIPAAMLDIGSQPGSLYAKIYAIANVAVDSRLVPYDTTTLSSTILGWRQPAGPLEAVDLNPSILRSDRQLFWMPDGLMLPGFWPPAVRAAAAVIDFGSPLPRGLTLADLATLGLGNPATSYVDYFNHRGVVSIHVPFAVEIVPEPNTRAALAIALALVLVVTTGRRHRHSCGGASTGNLASKCIDLQIGQLRNEVRDAKRIYCCYRA